MESPSLLEEKVARGTVTKYTSRIEELLGRGLGATGKGLGTKIGELQHRLPVDVTSDLSWLNHLRNKAAHDPKTDWLKNVDEFERRAINVIARLEAISGVKAIPTGEINFFKKPLNYVGGVLALAVIPIHSEALPALAIIFGIGMGATDWVVRYFKTH